MSNQQRCSIETLTLKNYRCFPELSLSFHDRLNVLVAPNGGGKTAILDGIAVALRLFVDSMEERPASKGFAAQDISLVFTSDQKMEAVTPVRLEAAGTFFGHPISWARQRQSARAARTTTVEAKELSHFAERLVKTHQGWVQRKNPTPPIFPLISYYGAGRLWDTRKLHEAKRIREIAPNARQSGYTDCLSSASHYKYFIDWFRRFSYEAKQETTAAQPSPHEPQRVLAAVRSAVDIALAPAGWYGLQWDFAEDTMVAQHNTDGQLPVSNLSDGIRNMIGLVADIAHRAARLNPHLREKAALQTPGIVLIDEVDMHLHPEWQQLVLPSLQEAFPLLQFIVTTHSPQVLTTLRKENIRILTHNDDGTWSAHEPTISPLAHESGDALAYIMDTHPRPQLPKVLPDIHAYEQLARSGRADSAEARQIKQRLDQAGFEFSAADQALFNFLSNKANKADRVATP
jgi:predicted ATP-binding protein involved in virulence